MGDENSRASDRETKPQDQMEKILEIVTGLDTKMSSIENRVQKLEEDDTTAIAYRSVNETVASEDSNDAEKLSLPAEG